ncbi:MAG: discoidin domain-containing protein, partial [Phycisphaerales bacterium]|nr:discoidin domain-containing protein [Phycisphaerales bacterium]
PHVVRLLVGRDEHRAASLCVRRGRRVRGVGGGGGGAAYGQLANLKVVTDASPDYSDMESMVRSITSNWQTDAEKMWALFYWDHKARRQTTPMVLHGYALGDPIRQYNDYGFTMCSTISGIKCSTWNYMGYPCRYWDIGNHTVPDVWYDGKFHHYDNSLSCYYYLPGTTTVAAVPDIGKPGSGPETGGKEVPGYIARYYAACGTGPDGYLQGADTARDLMQIAGDFSPNVLKYRYYYYEQDRGHRYSLNLRPSEVYTRYYSRQDVNSPNAVAMNKEGTYKADPAYFVPNPGFEGGKPFDPELVNPRYGIRGNGERSWTPPLNAASIAGQTTGLENITAGNNRLTLTDAAKPGFAIFKVEGANVITSLKIHAAATGNASLAISTNNGIQWKPIDKDIKDLQLIDEVNGAYEVLVKVGLNAGASLQSIAFDTITQVNSHTQPQLKLGQNTIYVGNGEQTGTIVLWPELRDGKYKPYVYQEDNLTVGEFTGWKGTLHYTDGGKEGYMIYKIDAPQDITSFTYGARMYNRADKNHIDFLHSLDGGKTWTKSYSYSDTAAPWDVIHYEKITNVPAGTKSVLIKYSLNGPGSWDSKKGDTYQCSLYAVHMEVNHKLAAPVAGPVEVTFNWQERQKDYTTVKRSHTQLVDKLPVTYTLNVGGYDQPIVDSLTVNLKGSRGTEPVKYGYSDGHDVGGNKFVGVWATYGKNLAIGKPYTLSIPSDTNWDAGDPDLKKLTDGRVGSSYAGGYAEGALWTAGKKPEITVDLGEVQKCAAFRIHTTGYEWWDAMKGENKDQVEVLTSVDGKEFTSQGFFDFNLHWKDIPVNYMYTDEGTFCGHNFFLAPKAPVQARFVKYTLTANRFSGVTEVQVLDSFEFKPFDLKIALPDPSQNGKAPPKPDVSPNAKKWKDGELPTTIGKSF